jgi:hypothetical protein
MACLSEEVKCAVTRSLAGSSNASQMTYCAIAHPFRAIAAAPTGMVYSSTEIL